MSVSDRSPWTFLEFQMKPNGSHELVTVLGSQEAREEVKPKSN